MAQEKIGMIDLDEISSNFSLKWEEVLKTKFITKNMHSLLLDWMDAKELPELRIPWKGLYDKFGGLRQGELTVLTGDTGSGKTTFAMNLAYHVSNVGHKSLILSLEMGPLAVVKKFFQMTTGRYQTKENLMECAKQVAEHALGSNIWVLNEQGLIQFDQLRKCILWAAIEEKCQLIVIDHFHLCFETEADAGIIEYYTAQLRKLASVLGIAVILICHPSKIRTKDGAKERPIEMDELKGSSGIKQFADNVLSIFYNKENNISNLFLKKIRDDRYGKNAGTKITYQLNKNLLFQELDNGTKES